MYGAIIGDIAGSRFEWHPHKSKDFGFIGSGCRVTDDSVMTVAAAEVLLEGIGNRDEETLINDFARSYHKWGNKYLNAGYGRRFKEWLKTENPGRYDSFGNGSAMRVSPVAWAADTLEEARTLARLSAMPTHAHPEGIKGAESVAAAIFMARNGASKEEIREYIEKEFGYDLDFTCDEIRPGYHFDVTCQGSVPEAIVAFLEADDYADAVRNAISLGGDADTQAAIAGSIAEACFGIPSKYSIRAKEIIPEDMQEVIDAFRARYMKTK